MTREHEDSDYADDLNMNAGFSAISNAANGDLMASRIKRRDDAGDFTALCARLRDPAVSLTMFEREWIARQLDGTTARPGRPSEAQVPLLYWWFRHADGLDRNVAIKAVCKLVSKSDRQPDGLSEQAVMKALQRAGGEHYYPGFGWWLNSERYRQGSRDPEIMPPALRTE
ncbi:hypothetical protein A6J80_09710 [Paracoccus yeei]|uniref:Uncharacterized protein n=1 Tax=Paracoccus yeei TaxID=147645 RepID=A0A1V0GS14_9RHOB|nr:hypothetical protein [Paracoccus yeei]ARC36623.1 hypothetical protein A6J80_09710 [Paracoccus yeei]